MAKITTGTPDGDIKITPNGTGKTVVGTGAANATVQSSGNHNLVLQTGNATTGSITITDGADGNIAITPNGTGEVDISKVDIDGGTIDGTTIGGTTPAAGTFTTFTSTGIDDNLTSGGPALTIDSSGNVTLAEDATINGITVGQGGSSVSTNTAVGTNALASNTTGAYNTANGGGALYSNTIGAYNTAHGHNTLYANTNTGSSNTGHGYAALRLNTTGSDNTAHGHAALFSNSTGTNNVAIGKSSGADALISITTQSNHVVLGNNSTTNFICKVSLSTPSDIRDKNITGVVNHGLEFIKQLNPIRFFFKKSREEPENHGPERYGFSAQEILELEGDDPIIINNKNPENLKMSSNDLIPVLVNAIKEQQAQIDAFTARLDAAGL